MNIIFNSNIKFKYYFKSNHTVKKNAIKNIIETEEL